MRNLRIILSAVSAFAALAIFALMYYSKGSSKKSQSQTDVLAKARAAKAAKAKSKEKTEKEDGPE